MKITDYADSKSKRLLVAGSVVGSSLLISCGKKIRRCLFDCVVESFFCIISEVRAADLVEILAHPRLDGTKAYLRKQGLRQVMREDFLLYAHVFQKKWGAQSEYRRETHDGALVEFKKIKLAQARMVLGPDAAQDMTRQQPHPATDQDLAQAVKQIEKKMEASMEKLEQRIAALVVGGGVGVDVRT